MDRKRIKVKARGVNPWHKQARESEEEYAARIKRIRADMNAECEMNAVMLRAKAVARCFDDETGRPEEERLFRDGDVKDGLLI